MSDPDDPTFTEEYMQRVDRNADAEWKNRAVACVHWLSTFLSELTTDDVWAAMATFYPELGTPERRAMGAVIGRAKAAGWIVQCTPKRQIPSVRPEAHKRPITVWMSVS